MPREPGLTLLAEVLAATADAHSPRAMVRAIGATLSRHLPITHIELHLPAMTLVAERSGNEWRSLDSAAAAPVTKSIAPGVAITASADLPAFCASAEFREALGQVIAAAGRHLDVIQRVPLCQRA